MQKHWRRPWGVDENFNRKYIYIYPKKEDPIKCHIFAARAWRVKLSDRLYEKNVSNVAFLTFVCYSRLKQNETLTIITSIVVHVIKCS